MTKADKQALLTRRALRHLLEAVTEIADVVREIDPGKVVTYDRIAGALSTTRQCIKEHGDAK